MLLVCVCVLLVVTIREQMYYIMYASCYHTILKYMCISTEVVCFSFFFCYSGPTYASAQCVLLKWANEIFTTAQAMSPFSADQVCFIHLCYMLLVEDVVNMNRITSQRSYSYRFSLCDSRQSEMNKNWGHTPKENRKICRHSAGRWRSRKKSHSYGMR